MANILTKQIQNKISRYFLKQEAHLTKPELRNVREMVVGILKSGSVLVNQLASSILDDIDLKQTTKRFRNHYNKSGFCNKLHDAHMHSVKSKIHHGDYIFFDGSDIQKKYAKMMEGLDFVKDGDKKSVGLGYWLMNAIHLSRSTQDITPLYSKLYSFDCGAKSENMEIRDAIAQTSKVINKDVTNVFDRGMDRAICIEFIILMTKYFILRLKNSTKLIYKGTELAVKDIAKDVPLLFNLSATKIHKNKKRKKTYACGAVEVEYKTKGKVHSLWLVVSKNEKGGYCYMLTRSPKTELKDVVEEAFTAYGYRWKIEEYHRHIKQCYNLEDIQIKTFDGLQSMLVILTMAMGIIYSSLSSLHTKLLLESGIKTLNKNRMYELCNFIYYKISFIVKTLISHMAPRAFIPTPKIQSSSGQLKLELDFD